MCKIVSKLDAEGYFIGQAVADKSPLEHGVFLIPGGCVNLPPPANIEPGKRYKPIGAEWIGEKIPEPISEPALTPDEIAATEAAAQRATTLFAISSLEAQQARPIREIVAALANGSLLPTIAVEKLGALDIQICGLRKLL